MRDAPVRNWRGTSAEERRDARREQIVEAGLDLFGSGGAEAVTLRAVCQAAGLTSRYYYEAFRDRDELLVAVYDRVHEETFSAITGAMSTTQGDLRTRARAAIAAGLTVITGDARKGRVFAVESATVPALVARRAERTGATVAMLAQIAHAHLDPAGRDRAELLLAARAIVGAETELVATYLAGSLGVTLDRLIDTITDLHFTIVTMVSAHSGQPHP